MTEMPINEFVTEQIRRLRQEVGIGIAEMARRSGIPQGSYSCLETSRYRMNLENLFRVLQILDVPITEVWPAADDVEKPATGIDAPYVRTYLHSARARLKEPLSIEEIVGLVCAGYGVTPEALGEPSRERLRAEARAVAALLVSEQGHLTQVRLARGFNRDVSSLSHCLRRLRERLATDTRLAARIQRLRRTINQLTESKRAASPGSPEQQAGTH